MEIPFRSTQTQQQKAATDEYEKRNFRLFLINGVFTRIGFRFVDSSMVLAAFVKELTKSNLMVGLTSSTMRAGWMWPQLLMSSLLEHRPRKMPFYIFGVIVRIIAWILILVLTLSIGNRNYLLLFLCFYLLYFVASSSMGVSTLPYQDIVAKSIPVQRRARLFSLRQLIGGLFGIGVGFLIRHILSEGFFLSFPHNYAAIFGLAILIMIGGFVIFVMVREPIHPVHDERKPFWQHLRRGAHFLKTDRDYRYFMIYRIASTFGSMCTSFYAVYALDPVGLGVPEATIGSFIAIGAISGVLSNILWVYIGEKYGSKSLLVVSSCLACAAPMIAASVKYMPVPRQTAFYFLVFIVSRAYMNGSLIAYMTYTLNLAPSKSRPTYLGFLNTLMFPMSLVPFLAGALLKVMSYESMFILSAIMAALAVYFAIRLSDVDKRDDIESKDD
ncbi:MFS transporter [Candidatus Poribacteria bacterium]